MARSSATRVARSSWSRRPTRPQSTPSQSTDHRQQEPTKSLSHTVALDVWYTPSPALVVVGKHGRLPTFRRSESGREASCFRHLLCAPDRRSESISVWLSRSVSVASRPRREDHGLRSRLSAALGANWSGTRAESHCLSPFGEERVLLADQDVRSVAVVVEIATGIDEPVYSRGEEPAGANLFGIEVNHVQYLVGGAAEGD